MNQRPPAFWSVLATEPRAAGALLEDGGLVSKDEGDR
jgi:hypothetical protein